LCFSFWRKTVGRWKRPTLRLTISPDPCHLIPDTARAPRKVLSADVFILRSRLENGKPGAGF
jgi:hypothetical protein